MVALVLLALGGCRNDADILGEWTAKESGNGSLGSSSRMEMSLRSDGTFEEVLMHPQGSGFDYHIARDTTRGAWKVEGHGDSRKLCVLAERTEEITCEKISITSMSTGVNGNRVDHRMMVAGSEVWQ